MKKIVYTILVFFIMAAGSLANAQTTYYWADGINMSLQFPSPDAACRYFYAQGNYTVGQYVDARPTGNPINWVCHRTYMAGNSGTVNFKQVTRYGSSCPAGITYDPLTGTCPVPPPPTCAVGSKVTSTFYRGYGPVGTKVATQDKQPYPKSDGQCVVDYDVVECWGNNSSTRPGNEDIYCRYEGTRTGAVTPAGEGTQPSTVVPTSDSKPRDHDPFSPAQGKGCPSGTVNLGTDSAGGSICGGSGISPQTPTTTETTQPPTTVTNPDGGTTKTEVSTRGNADGSTTTTTKKTTTAPNGTVTVEIAVNTGPASGGGAGRQDSNDFCAKNPTLSVCRNSTVSGDCENTSCQGDAIQCAILRQQRKMACDFSKPDAISNLGDAMMNGNDPLKNTFPTRENARVVNMQQLSANGFLGGGQCFPDVQFEFRGMTFTLPFSKACDYLIALRGVVMLLAALASWKVISRSILG